MLAMVRDGLIFYFRASSKALRSYAARMAREVAKRFHNFLSKSFSCPVSFSGAGFKFIQEDHEGGDSGVEAHGLDVFGNFFYCFVDKGKVVRLESYTLV